MSSLRLKSYRNLWSVSSATCVLPCKVSGAGVADFEVFGVTIVRRLPRIFLVATLTPGGVGGLVSRVWLPSQRMLCLTIFLHQSLSGFVSCLCWTCGWKSFNTSLNCSFTKSLMQSASNPVDLARASLSSWSGYSRKVHLPVHVSLISPSFACAGKLNSNEWSPDSISLLTSVPPMWSSLGYIAMLIGNATVAVHFICPIPKYEVGLICWTSHLRSCRARHRSACCRHLRLWQLLFYSLRPELPIPHYP